MNSQQYLQTRGGGVSSVIDEPSFYSIIFILVFILYAIKAIWYTLFRCWGCVSAGQVSTLVSEGEGAGSCMVICTWFSEKNKNNKWNCTKVRYSKDDYLTTIQNYITLFSKRCHPKLFSQYLCRFFTFDILINRSVSYPVIENEWYKLASIASYGVNIIMKLFDNAQSPPWQVC